MPIASSCRERTGSDVCASHCCLQGIRVRQRLTTALRSPVIFNSMLLAALLLTFFVASSQVRAYAGDVRRDAFTLQGAIPAPVLRYTPPASARLPVVAVLAHGYAASKEIMSAFAVDLAKQGITVYTFDFPGHGASTAYYGGLTHDHVVDQLVSTLGEVVDYATAHSPANAKVVLLGYSLGTIAVGDYALQHPKMSNLSATILVAGILKDKPTLTNAAQSARTLGPVRPAGHQRHRAWSDRGGLRDSRERDPRDIVPVRGQQERRAQAGHLAGAGSHLHRDGGLDPRYGHPVARRDGGFAHRQDARQRRHPAALDVAGLPRRAAGGGAAGAAAEPGPAAAPRAGRHRLGGRAGRWIAAPAGLRRAGGRAGGGAAGAACGAACQFLGV